MPSTPIRRPLTVIGWVIMSAAVLGFAPVLLALAAVAAVLTRDCRPLIFARVLVAYLACELATLLACGALWLAAAGGRWIGRPLFKRLHWRLLRWFLRGLAGQVVSALRIGIEHDPSPDADAALSADGPLLIFSRHAGPADTLLIGDRLMSGFGRQPSVVFKETLVIDPCVDLLSHRLPHAVIDISDRRECETEIARVSRQLGPRGVLLLFPEGANVTRQRRRSALAKLRRKGRDREAGAAERMPHLLPPHPLGAQCALAAHPGADVVFAAHTGLGLAADPRALWREMPVGRTLHTRMWLVRAADVPSDPEAQAEWLYAWWRRIEEWVEEVEADVPREPSPAR
jgi:hypothetical protein